MAANTEKVPFTKDGHTRLQLELTKLKTVERPKVISDIAEARAHGDLKENAEYHAAREKQGFIEGRINELEDKLSRAQVIDFSTDDGDQVKFGAYVLVCDENSGEEKTLRIVGDLEADLNSGLISVKTPLARALLGKQVGDLVQVKVPKGTVEYSINEVRFN